MTHSFHWLSDGLNDCFLVVQKQGKSPLYVSAFQWKNCGAPDKESLVIEKFSVSPDPIVIPGTLTTNLIATFNHTVDAPLQVKVLETGFKALLLSKS